MCVSDGLVCRSIYVCAIDLVKYKQIKVNIYIYIYIYMQGALKS